MTQNRSGVEVREVSDAKTLRALTHPTRVALLEMLFLHGPMTATEASEHVGESPSSCSFHLRQLARYGFVEEAGGGRGRQRPWRLTSFGMSFSGVHDDPEADIAADALTRLLSGRQLDRHETWLRTRRSYPRAWRKAASESEYAFWMTAGELDLLMKRLNEELLGLYHERLADQSLRPEGAVPVEVLVYGYPIAPPASGS